MRPACRALGELRNDGPRLFRGHWIARCLSGNHNICLGQLIAVRYSPWRLWPHRRINIFVVHNWTAYLLITSVLIHPLILLFSTNSRWRLLDVALPVRSPVQPIENTIGAVSVYLIGVVLLIYRDKSHRAARIGNMADDSRRITARAIQKLFRATGRLRGRRELKCNFNSPREHEPRPEPSSAAGRRAETEFARKRG